MRPISQMDKAQLLAKLQQGNEAVFQGIYDEYPQPFVDWAANRYQLDRETLLDVFQEAVAELFLKVKKKQYDPEKASLKTYLYSIGTNHIRERIREASLNPTDNAWSDVESCSDRSIAAYQSGINETNSEVDNLLQDVDYTHRRVMELYYLEGCSMSEIARRLGYSNSDAVKAVKYRIVNYIKSNFGIKALE
jgi:RNA polymerase sigma factor (sigma-70 family)